MLKKKGFVLVVFLMVFSVVGLVGCNSKEAATNTDAGEVETITITHELGEATVVKNPERVIVFDYATLDSLNQMDVEVIGLPKSHIPEYLSKYRDAQYEDVGTLFEPNYEKIYELSPDLILISGRQRDLYDEFTEIAPTVFLALDNQDFIGSFSNNLKVLGDIFDEIEFVNSEIARVETQINEVNNKVAEMDKNALIIMANDGALSVYGYNSRFNVIHQEFGFKGADENIEVSNHGQSISFEYILEVNPDIIFVIDRAAVTGGSNAAQNVLDNDIIKMTNAYKNDAINYLSPHEWYVTAGGLEGANTMIEEIVAAIQ